MTRRSFGIHLTVIATVATVCISITAHAQLIVRPLAGIQSMVFNGDNQARRPISPGTDPALSFGGGLSTSNNGVRIGLELIPDPESVIRIPFTAEYYWFDGKTTFAVPSNTGRIEQLRYHFSANMLSIGTGIKASFFNKSKLSLYVSGEGRFNYIPPTTLSSRLFFFDNGELLAPEATIAPDTVGRGRFGAVVKIGTQADFFDPLMLDFSIGYGAVNLVGRDNDSTSMRDILTAEPQLRTAERTLGFITFGFSILWVL